MSGEGTGGMLRIGWVGCGTHATQMLLPQIARLPARVVALCDREPSRLAAMAARLNLSADACFADVEAMLTAGGLDAVGAAVGPAAHPDIACAALARGLAVFLEKPPAQDLAGARRVALAAARAGRPVVVGFMKRHSTANRIAGNVMSDPGFGPRASLLGHYLTAPSYFAGDPDYSGFFLHHCVHAMDLAPWLMASPVTAVRARRHELAPGKLLLHVDFDFASGALGTVVMGTHQSRGTPMEWWQVLGDHRRVEVRNVHEVRLYRHNPLKADDPAATLRDGEDALVWEPNHTAAADEDHKGYRALLAAFVQHARGAGDAPPAPMIADGARAMAVLEAMVRSIETGRSEAPEAG
jgi:myo-inositol 2-dehydrogenase/D-chiro-inositol 1-dehydrogenase